MNRARICSSFDYMGIGHHQHKQHSFLNSNQYRLSYGGELRKKKLGRGQRPLSTKHPIRVVFKVQRLKLKHRSLRTPRNFQLVLSLIKKYSQYFYIKVEQLSVQHDHIHILIRTSRRKQFHNFFRVVTGQIAQNLEKARLLSMTDTPKGAKRYIEKAKSLWKHRPFSRVVCGWKSYKIIRNYIQLNEKEVLGQIKYQKNRLRCLSSADWQILWS